MTRPTFAILTVLMVAGCVQSGASGPGRVDPALAAAETATGVSAANIVAYSANGAGIGGLVIAGLPNILFYKVATTDAAQLKAAPARICGTRGVASAEDQSLEHPDQMPGVRKLVVNCK